MGGAFEDGDGGWLDGGERKGLCDLDGWGLWVLYLFVLDSEGFILFFSKDMN